MRIIQCLLLLTVLTFSNLAFTQEYNYEKLSEEELPTNVEISFYNIFKNARNVRWYGTNVENQEFYKGEFVKDGQLTALVFNKDAKTVRQIISTRRNDIPEEIVNYFADTHEDYRLIRLSKISIVDSQSSEETYSFFKLIVKAGDREIAFQFDNDHELFKGKQYFEDVNYLQ